MPELSNTVAVSLDRYDSAILKLHQAKGLATSLGVMAAYFNGPEKEELPMTGDQIQDSMFGIDTLIRSAIDELMTKANPQGASHG